MDSPDIFAWIGEDENGEGWVGLKQALTPAGMVPLAAVERHRAKMERMLPALQQQARQYGKTIRLVRYVAVEDVMVVEP